MTRGPDGGAPRRPGPTKRFPQGRLGADDDGEVAIGVRIVPEHKAVLMAFGTPTAWVGLDVASANALAATVAAKADELDPDHAAPDANKPLGVDVAVVDGIIRIDLPDAAEYVGMDVPTARQFVTALTVAADDLSGAG